MTKESFLTAISILIAILSHVASCSQCRAVSHAKIQAVAGTGFAEFNTSEGDALQVNVGNPYGVEIGPDGALYICEVDNHRILRFDRETKQISAVAGTGEPGYSGDGKLATQAMLNEPYEVRFDKVGNMFFVEMQNHLIRRVDCETGIISTVAGSGQAGFSGDGGPATKARMNRPHSIAFGEEGYLYVADIGNHRIRRVDLGNQTIETLAGNGEQFLPQDGHSVHGKPLLGPRALAVKGSELWIALREGHSVWKLELNTGLIKHIAGTGLKGYSGDDGPGRLATFNGPKGIAVGPRGNVFVADTENQVIRRLDVSTNTVTTVAGSGPGSRGGKGDGGLATESQLNRPHGICVDEYGTIFIGDSENHRVRTVRHEPTSLAK